MVQKFHELFENVQQAKSILKKHNGSTEDEAYQTIRGMLEKIPGWVGVFTKFHYEEQVPVDSLAVLFDELTRLRPLLPRLPMPVDKFEKYEQLVDALGQLEIKHSANQLLKELNREQRDAFAATGEDAQTRLEELAPQFYKLSAPQRTEFLKKMRANTGKNFLSRLESYIDANTTGFSMEQVVAQVKETPGARVVHQDEDNQYLVVELSSYAASVALNGATTWCIRNNSSLWDNYAGLDTNNTQYTIYNFNVKLSDIHSMVGVTVKPDSGYYTAHWKNDQSTWEEPMAAYYDADWEELSSHLRPISPELIEQRQKLKAATRKLKEFYSGSLKNRLPNTPTRRRIAEVVCAELQRVFPEQCDFYQILMTLVSVDSLSHVQALMRNEAESLRLRGFNPTTFAFENGRNSHNTVMEVAAGCECTEIITFLREKRVSVDKSAYRTFITTLTQENHADMRPALALAKELYDYQRRIGKPVEFVGDYALNAVQGGDVELLKSIIADNADALQAEGYDLKTMRNEKDDTNLFNTAIHYGRTEVIQYFTEQGAQIEPHLYHDYVNLNDTSTTPKAQAAKRERLNKLYNILKTQKHIRYDHLLKVAAVADAADFIAQIVAEKPDELATERFVPKTMSFERGYDLWYEASLNNARTVIDYFITQEIGIDRGYLPNVGENLIEYKNVNGAIYYFSASAAGVWKADCIKLIVRARKASVYKKFLASTYLSNMDYLSDLCVGYVKLGSPLGEDPEFLTYLREATVTMPGAVLKMLALTNSDKKVFLAEYERMEAAKVEAGRNIDMFEFNDEVEGYLALRLLEYGKLGYAVDVMKRYGSMGKGQHFQITYPVNVMTKLFAAGKHKTVAHLLRRGAVSIQSLTDDKVAQQMPAALTLFTELGGKLKTPDLLDAVYRTMNSYFDENFEVVIKALLPFKAQMPVSVKGENAFGAFLALGAFGCSLDREWLPQFLALDPNTRYDAETQMLVMDYASFEESQVLRLYETAYGANNYAYQEDQVSVNFNPDEFKFDRVWNKLNATNLKTLQRLFVARGYPAMKSNEMQNQLWAKAGTQQQSLDDIKFNLRKACYYAFEQDTMSDVWANQLRPLHTLFRSVNGGFYEEVPGKGVRFVLRLPVSTLEYKATPRLAKHVYNARRTNGFNTIDILEAIIKHLNPDPLKVKKKKPTPVVTTETYNEFVERALDAIVNPTDK